MKAELFRPDDGAESTTIRVLHVEDDPAHARLARELVAEAGGGFDLWHVDTIEAATDVLESERFDVVLLDLRLPDGRGVPAFKRVTQAAGPTPIVILSSLGDERLAVEAVGAGAEDYLVKDQVSPETLTRALRHAIRRRSRGTLATVPRVPRTRRATVALVGRHALMLEALATALAGSVDFEVVGSFAGPDALQEAGGRAPVDLVVLESVGAPAAHPASLREQLGADKVVLLAGGTDRDLSSVLDRHADGLVLTSSTSEQIVGALTQVLAGQLVLPGGWRSLEPSVPSASKLDELSARQLEILELVAEGCSNDEIAVKLFISVNTVKFHVRTLYTRLGIHNRVQAALLLADARSRP